MLESKNTAMPDEKMTFEHGEVSLVNLTGLTVGRAELRPGWRWSTDIKPHAGTESCQLTHSAYVVSGRLHVAMDDGLELELGPGDAHVASPGHDAWVAGDEPCVIIDFIPDGAAALGAPAGPDDAAAVRTVIDGYGGALRSGDVAAIAELFTAGAAIMADGFPAAVGQAQITDIYTSALASVGMDYSYEFDQVEVAGDTAVARTRSTGTTTVRASGETSPARYRELFVLRREGAGWRISAYMYQPQPQAA
jgi:uncharacterized protein (TIGR02246 family)